MDNKMHDLREWSFQSPGLSTKHRPRGTRSAKIVGAANGELCVPAGFLLAVVRSAMLGVAFLLLDTPASGATLGDTGLTLTSIVNGATEYSARGLSQSEESPATQAIFDLATRSGVYIGTFTSTAKYQGLDYTMENDGYIGYRIKIGQFSADSQILYANFSSYSRPLRASRLDYSESRTELTYDLNPVRLAFAFWYSPNFSGHSGAAYYFEGGADVNLPNQFKFSARVGHEQLAIPSNFGFPDWVNWNISFGHPIYGPLVGSIGLVGTNISRQDCAGGQNLCQNRLLVLLTAKF